MTDRPSIVIQPDPSSLADAAARHIAQAIRDIVGAGRRCSMGLAGGGTPRAIFERLAAMDDIPWAEVDFYYGDERCVPPDDPDSNHRMASESLLTPIGAAPSQIFRMEAEREDRDQAAADYAALLPDSIDLLLLGMGPDGHTASLFPDHEAIGERALRVIPVIGPKPPPWRLTITIPVIEAAAEVIVLAHGANKAEMVARAIEGTRDLSVVPIQAAIPGTWFLDEAAASGLKKD